MRTSSWVKGVRGLVFVGVCVGLLVGGRAEAADEGGSAGAFLRLDIGARAAGMGGAFTAIADGPAGFHYNPAGPAWVAGRQAEVSYRKMGFDRQHGFAAVLVPLRKEAAIVGSWVHAGVSNTFERDGEGELGDQINESNNAVGFTFAKRFTPFWSLGINLRYVQTNIANINAYTVGFDFGTLICVPRSTVMIGGPRGLTDLRLGVVVERINYKYPWNTYDYWIKQGESGQSFEERWPINVRGGMAISVYEQKANLAVDVEVNQKSGSLFHAGVEVMPHSALALRGGINGTHFTAGAGVKTNVGRTTLFVDYAYSSTDEFIDNEHLISIGARF